MRCPSLNILGTFFPSWMLCVLAGIIVAVVAHALVARLRLDAALRPPLVLYPSIVVGITAVLWLGFYGH